jgi:hypothetical protein
MQTPPSDDTDISITDALSAVYQFPRAFLFPDGKFRLQGLE